MTSPYTNSRQRVLTAYRHHRRHGLRPYEAMELVVRETSAQIGRVAADGSLGSRAIAMLEWDKAHAKRYLSKIGHRTTFYWQFGCMPHLDTGRSTR